MITPGVSTSESIDKIAPALVKAVNAVQAVLKDNQGHGYKFADLAACIAEAKRVLGANGMTVLQPPAVRGATGSLVEGEVVASPVQLVRTMILHESGQWLAAEAIVPEGAGAPKMSVAQAIGSAITYMRRYSLCSILSIPVEDDDGAGAGSSPRGGRGGGHQPRDDGYSGGSNGYSPRDDRFPTSPQRPAGPDHRVAERAASQPPARRPSAPPPRQADGPPIESYTPPAGRR